MGVTTFVVVAALAAVIFIMMSKCDPFPAIPGCREQVNDPKTCKATCNTCKPLKYLRENKCFVQVDGCVKQVMKNKLEYCTTCNTTHNIWDGKCIKKNVHEGCVKDKIYFDKGVNLCSKSLINYHLINNTCQKKILPSACDGYTNNIWKNGVDYCNQCKSTNYTYEGICYQKTANVGCAKDKGDYNSKLKEHCTECLNTH